MNQEEILLMAVLIKWMRSEPMSSTDLDRLMGMIATRDINVDSSQPDEINGMRQKLQNILREKFFSNQQ